MTKTTKSRKRPESPAAAADPAPRGVVAAEEVGAAVRATAADGLPADRAADGFDALAPLSSRALFWRARHVAPSPFLGALPLLFWLIETARPQGIAVLGLDDTVPFLGACQAVERLGLECLCLGLPAGDAAADPVPDAVRAAIHEFYADFARAESAVADGVADGAVLDLLIVAQPVDADLAEALEARWLPALSSRGIVLFAHGPAAGFEAGYARLTRRLAAAHGAFRFASDGQAALIPLGPDQPDRLRRLAGLGPGQTGHLMVRHVFARLGEANERALEARRENELGRAARRERDTLRAQLDKAEAALAKQTARADTLAEQLAAKTAQVATVQAQTFDAERDAEAMRAEAENLRAGMATQAAQLSEAAAARDAVRTEAEGLRAELAAVAEKLSEIRAARDAARSEAEGLRSDLAAQAARLAEVDSARDAARAEAERLRTELAAREEDIAVLGRQLKERTELAARLSEADAARDAGRSEAEGARAELAAQAARLAEADSARNAARAEAEGLRAELSAREEDIAVLGRQLKERTELVDRADADLRAERDLRATLVRLQPVRDRIQTALARPRVSATHRALRRALDAELALIVGSGLFDADWYRRRYPDVDGGHLPPEEHFVRLGAYEGRNPGPKFDSLAYHRAYPDVAEAGQAALMHYLRYGRDEGRTIFPVADALAPPG